MRTQHLRGVLACPQLRRSFKTAEVLALNEIPHSRVRLATPAIYIVNSEPNFNQGAHWVAVCLRKKSAPEFFDPLGLPPSEYSPNLVKFLKSNSTDGSYERSTTRVQRDGSTLCGPYCLLYGVARGGNSESTLYDICEKLRKMSEIEVLTQLGTHLASNYS